MVATRVGRLFQDGSEMVDLLARCDRCALQAVSHALCVDAQAFTRNISDPPTFRISEP